MEEGIDQIAFQVRTNPGTLPGPLMKVASGGELSRFLLALKVVLADRGSAPMLVFDEIDTGVGGAVADAIGRRLARLVEARAGAVGDPCAAGGGARDDAFLFIESRRAPRARRAHRIRRMDGPARQEEIARMLAGATITAEARAAAGGCCGKSSAAKTSGCHGRLRTWTSQDMVHPRWNDFPETELS